MHFVRCTLYFIDAVPALPARVSRLNNERLSSRFSFHHRKAIVCHSRIVEDEANKTRSIRSLTLLRDRISDYIIGLRIPGEWFQTLVMYERNLELRYFDALCSKLDGAPRSQKRLRISRGGKVSCLMSGRLFPPSFCRYSLSVDLSTGKKLAIKNSALKRWKKITSMLKVEIKGKRSLSTAVTFYQYFSFNIFIYLFIQVMYFFMNLIWKKHIKKYVLLSIILFW